MDPAAPLVAIGRTLGKGLRVIVTFVGLALLGVVAAGLTALPPYLAFRFGPESNAAALTAGGAIVSLLVAYYVAGPLFTSGASYLGKKYS